MLTPARPLRPCALGIPFSRTHQSVYWHFQVL